MHQIVPPPVTETLAQYVSDLEQANEYDSDAFLVRLVKIQHATNTIVGFEDTSWDLETISSLHTQLENIRTVTTPPHDLDDGMLVRIPCKLFTAKV